jgi:hypothetical protein
MPDGKSKNEPSGFWDRFLFKVGDYNIPHREIDTQGKILLSILYPVFGRLYWN